MASAHVDLPVSRSFDERLADCGLHPLTALSAGTLQINLGRLCNQACLHCHVEAGPNRTEQMSRDTLQACLKVVRENEVGVVDLTGGAPEMNSEFCWFVDECRRSSVAVKVRSNLTIYAEAGYEYMPEFLAEREVEIIASLPCYTQENVDRQRGKDTFRKSVSVIERLNKLGYSRPGSNLVLTLVYNPGGASLPGDQQSLTQDYRKQLRESFGLEFTNLLTITNMPIGRFKTHLEQERSLGDYMTLLESSFNRVAAEKVMCRELISIGWDGRLYDCDFNQMLKIGCNHGAPTHISQFAGKALQSRVIATGPHCYGCTAGAGSSCSGALDR